MRRSNPRNDARYADVHELDFARTLTSLSFLPRHAEPAMYHYRDPSFVSIALTPDAGPSLTFKITSPIPDTISVRSNSHPLLCHPMVTFGYHPCRLSLREETLC